jgi:Outer membrane protein beta-barrel domain
MNLNSKLKSCRGERMGLNVKSIFAVQSRVTHFIRLAVLGFVFLGAGGVQAWAQVPSGATPQFEVAGGYAYTRGNSDAGSSFDMNGGTASFTYNFRDHFAVVGDFGAYRFSNVGPGLSSTMYTYLFGPRLPLRRSSGEGRFAPFVQVLVGGGRLNANANGISAGENSVAVAAGGGLDFSARGHLSVRLVEAEYLLTRFPHPDGTSATQNNVRISAGIVLRFGNK